MSKLSSANFLRLVLLGLACSTLLTVTGRPARAGEPEGVLRTFIVFLNGDLTVDFLHEDSVMVKAAKSTAPTLFGFVDDNDPEAMAQLWGSMADQDYRDQIGHLAVPMLVTYGEQSQFYDKEASEWLVSHAPNATMVGFPKSGHALQLEEPEQFNEEVRKFAASISKQDDT